MKLHLNKSLRTALLACVCGAVAFTCQAFADNEQLPADYNLTAGTTYDLSYEGNTAEGKDLTLSAGEGSHGLYVGADTTITANKVSGSGQSFTKEGDGTLIISGSNARPQNVIVNAGMLQIGYGDSGTGFVTGDVTVNGGGTLKLTLKDSLGWSGGWGTGDFTDTLTLEGSTTGEGDNVVVKTAALELSNSQTLSTIINLKGNSTISGGSFIAWNDNKITATSTNNTISSTLKTCKDLNIEVTGENDTLLVSGVVGYTTNNSTNNATHDLIKTGAGTLTLSNTVESGSDIVINEGKVILASGSSVNQDNVITVNSGSSLEISGGTTLADITVNDGTMEISQGADGWGNSVARGAISVLGGSTLLLSAKDSLGWSSSNHTSLLTLAGSITGEGEAATVNHAEMIVNGDNETLVSDVKLNGNTKISGTGFIDAYGGTITATGTNNVISATLHTRKQLDVIVDGENSTLTVQGTLRNTTNGEKISNDLVKTGAGTLILASSASVASDVDVIVDEGTLRQEGNKDNSYILRGGTIELNDNRIGSVGADNATNTSTGTITLQAETDGTTSENTIKSGNKAGAVFASITGEGNLTLENSVNVYSNMDFTGNLTLASGHTNIGHSGYGSSPTIGNTGNITIASGATAKFDAQSGNDATLIQNSGDITVNGSLEVSKATVNNGGSICVDGENASLQLGAAATINSSITVQNGGTIDLTNVTTLNTTGLDLAAGTTIKLGQNPVELSGTLTLAEGVVFDLSSWCDNASFQPYMPIFTLSGEGQFSPTLEGLTVTVKVSDYTNPTGWLTLSEDGRTVMLVPEPATATLSLLALAALAARRRRK